jgi:hypothetical protein
MAELTRTQLKAAADRATELSLADDDVALQTADTMPEGLGVRGERLDTAGSDQHGPVYSFTRKQVDKALDAWPEREASRSSSGRRTGGDGRRRGGRRANVTQTDTETGTAATPPTKPAGTSPPPADDQPGEDSGS